MTMPDALLQAANPCPFCGGTPSTVERPDNIDGTEFFYAVACYCGGYSACAHKMAKRKTPEQAKADAIAAWNRRAAPPAESSRALVAPGPFIEWANGEGYDIANTYDTERSRWVFFNPMTADLWNCWQAARQGVRALEEAQEGREAPSLTIDAGEVRFLATRLRRLCKHFNFSLPEGAEDDAQMIGMAGSAIGLMLNAASPSLSKSQTSSRGDEAASFPRPDCWRTETSHTDAGLMASSATERANYWRCDEAMAGGERCDQQCRVCSVPAAAAVLDTQREEGK